MTETEGKGRPTPKRSDAQKRRTGPVAPPPTNRRAAARQLREKQADNRKRVREGSLRGDETALLKRDRGPVRRHVRDVIDGRRSLAWILLPIALAVVVSGLASRQLEAFVFLIWMAAMAAAAIEMLVTGVQLRAELRTAFPDETSYRGHIVYGLMRTTVMRRWRVPRPQARP